MIIVAACRIVNKLNAFRMDSVARVSSTALRSNSPNRDNVIKHHQSSIKSAWRNKFIRLEITRTTNRSSLRLRGNERIVCCRVVDQGDCDCPVSLLAITEQFQQPFSTQESPSKSIKVVHLFHLCFHSA